VHVAGVGGEVHVQRAIPDLLGLNAADADDGRGRPADRAGAVGRGAGALGEVEEEVVARTRAVVHVDAVGAGRPAAVRRAVQSRVVHVAQRGPVAVDVDLLADLVVTRVGRRVGVEL